MGGSCNTHGRDEIVYKILVGKRERRTHLEDVGVDGGIILECVLLKWGGKVWSRLNWLRTETSGGLL